MVATGIPGGIWTIDKSESKPFKQEESMGTPITGSVVKDATTPGRWAAQPAAAIITSMPVSSIPLIYSVTNSGVLCADAILNS